MLSRISRRASYWVPSWASIIMTDPVFGADEPPLSASAARMKISRFLRTMRKLRRSFRFANLGRSSVRLVSAICWLVLARATALAIMRIPKGDDVAAKQVVLRLAHDAGCRGFDAGGLVNAVAAESLTAVMIALNRRYKARGAGIRVTGLPEDADDV